jgi:hypothetical protein
MSSTMVCERAKVMTGARESTLLYCSQRSKNA